MNYNDLCVLLVKVSQCCPIYVYGHRACSHRVANKISVLLNWNGKLYLSQSASLYIIDDGARGSCSYYCLLKHKQSILIIKNFCNFDIQR